MKIRNSSRVTALVLALVMILPLISIPAFAEPAQTPTPVWSQNFDGAANLGDVLAQYPKSAKIENGALVIDRKATWGTELAVLYTDRTGAVDVTEVAYADGSAWTGIENYSGAPVKVTTKEGTGITGVITTAANATGNVNSCTVVTDKGTYAGNKTLAIVEAVVANAIVGNCNNAHASVAREAYLKNTVITPTDENVIVLSAKYMFGTGFATGQIESRVYGYAYENAEKTSVKANVAIDLFIAKTNGNKVQIVKHGDNTDVLNGNIGVLVNKGEWIDLRFVIDVSGKCPVTYCYVNDELAFITAEDRSGNDWSNYYGFAYLSANKWNLGHTSRGVSAKALNESTNNTVTVDNCAIYTSLEGFENEGYKFSDNDIKVYEQDFENLTVSGGKVQAGNDFAGVEGILTVETTEGNKWVKSEYGIIDNSNRDKNNMLKIPALSYKYFDWVKLEASYNIQLGKYAIGEIITQFRNYSSLQTGNKSWFNLYTIYVGNGDITAGGVRTTGVMKDGWNTVTLYLNLKTGQEALVVNGKYISSGYALDGTTKLTNIELFSSSEGYGKWTALKLDRSAMSYTDGVDYGYVGLDDASVTCLSGEPSIGSLYEVNFENDTVNSAPAAFDSSQNTHLVDAGKVVQEGTNKYWEIPVSATNNNKHAYIYNPAVSYTSTFVYEADNYISQDANGNLEARFTAAAGTFINKDGTTIANRGVSWLTMYKLTYTANSNTVTVTPGGNQNGGGVIVANNTFNKGEWAKITVVIDTVNGVYDIYLNNKLIIANICFIPQYYDGGWIVGTGLKDVQITANKLVITPNSSAAAGSARFDNITFYDTTDGLNLVDSTPAPYAGYSEDFSTNTPAIKNLNASQKDPTDPVSSTVVNGAYSIPTADSTTTNVNVTATNAAFNYLNAPKVVLEAKYTIPENGVMKFQSQFFNASAAVEGAAAPELSKSWVDLYTVTATNLNAAPTITLNKTTKAYRTELQRGAEFTVSTVIDMKTGDAALYVDGILYAEGRLFRDNYLSNVIVPANKWIIAKPNTVPSGVTYVGDLLVDDAKITLLDETKLHNETGKGLVSAKVNGKLVKDATKFYGTVTEQKYVNAATYGDIVATNVELGSLRLGEELTSSGLRFATKVDTDLMAQLKAMLANDEIKALTFGTLVAPAKYMEENGDLNKTAYTVYDETANEGAGNFVAGSTVVDIQATAYTLSDIDGDAATTHFVGSLVSILEKNYNREFAARGYVEVTLYNGEVIFLGSETIATNSVKAQAEELIAQEIYAGNDAVMDILNAYAGIN